MTTKLTIQHKRSSVAGNQPTAAQLAVGELAINFADKKLYTKTGAGVVIPLGGSTGTDLDIRVQAAATAPTTRTDLSALADGDLWYDTTANELKVRDTGAWVLVDTAFQFDWQSGAGVPTKTTRADNVTALVEGDMYWDTTNNNLYVRDAAGSAWVLVGSKWTTETGGISRADRIKVGAAGAPAAAIDVVGTIAHPAQATTGAMNLLLSDRFTCSVTAATTFSFVNPPATRSAEVILRVTNGGAFTITWPAGVTWIAGSQPTLKSAGTDIILFWTHDGGTSWYAEAVGQTSSYYPTVAEFTSASGVPASDNGSIEFFFKSTLGSLASWPVTISFSVNNGATWTNIPIANSTYTSAAASYSNGRTFSWSRDSATGLMLYAGVTAGTTITFGAGSPINRIKFTPGLNVGIHGIAGYTA